MPLCTLHLLSLHTTTPSPISAFLSALKATNLKPLVISRVIRWIILPKELSTESLLARNIHWDLLLILPSTDALPSSLQSLVQHDWTVTAGIPSRLLKDFSTKNNQLLHPAPESVPQLTGALKNPKVAQSAQNLELSPELQAWVQSFYNGSSAAGRGAVSMLNLLSFKPGLKGSYLKYGAAFASDVGSKRGGNAKLVGTVVDVAGKKKEGDGGWDEIALAHYPSILHFADMLGGRDYQEANSKWRVPALKDTFILCTSEIAVEEMLQGKQSKL
ncbi:uncharacterized protein EI97DRAFT_79942 [Westerdykella ornata]|uniref:Uncharacterized protein n=1 Tax=Westerdykella ornata TaxID=318751 RepID=A0A6A6JFT4_WESOR|nr:uncharacterized protein EI97DRAFT_79942 [Westerdykella ornata]KAF2275187.1 hypothetical protein EI97DRAFT_79942 [Westerdykella ornata]